MQQATTQSHAIAPARVLRGPGAWADALPAITALCQRPLLLGRSAATTALRQGLEGQLRGAGLEPVAACLQHDCCESEIGRAHV